MRIELQIVGNGAVLTIIRPQEGKNVEKTEVLVFEDRIDLLKAISDLWDENWNKKSLTKS